MKITKNQLSKVVARALNEQMNPKDYQVGGGWDHEREGWYEKKIQLLERAIACLDAVRAHEQTGMSDEEDLITMIGSMIDDLTGEIEAVEPLLSHKW